MKLGEKLKKARNQKGYTLRQMSILTTIPTGTLHDYESGKIKNISLDRLRLLANIYEKDPNYFIIEDTPELEDYTFNSNTNTLLTIMSTLIEKFELLDIEKKIELLEYTAKFIYKNK